jgi:hypothetical protein
MLQVVQEKLEVETYGRLELEELQRKLLQVLTLLALLVHTKARILTPEASSRRTSYADVC